MAVPSEARVETVTLEMTVRERALRVAVFLTLGCLLGAGVEVLVRPGPVSAGTETSTSAQAALTREREMARARAERAASVKDAGEKTAAPPTHHHHVHHTESPATPARPPESAMAVDAGSESDDLAAAIKTLAKAKQEETLP